MMFRFTFSIVSLLMSIFVAIGCASRPTDLSEKVPLRAVPVQKEIGMKSRSVAYNKGNPNGQVGIKKLNPIWWLNNADTDYDDTWKPGKSHQWRKFTFAIRNPGHNFTHYVIGVNDRDFVRYGRDANQIWNRGGRINTAVIHHGMLRLPFYSYQGRIFDHYFGWRERGNFGIAFRRAHAPDRTFPKKAPALPQSSGER